MIRLIHGDCLEVLPTLAGIEAVVADPPYGISYRHSGGGKGVPARRHTRSIIGDDAPFDPTPWLDFPCILWGADHFAASLPPRGTWLAWDKAAGGGPADSFADCEFAFSNAPGIKRNIYRCLWKGVCRQAGEERRWWHPTQKPVGLMRWCIERLKLRPGATILDPYLGSGTTGVAAVELGFSFVGIEIEESDFRIAERRIARAEVEHPLFAALTS